MQFSNWKIVHKLTAAFGLLVAVMALVGAFATSELQSISAKGVQLDKETSSLAALREAKLSLARQENSFRGWVISRDGYYLQRLATHRDNFLKSLDVADDNFAGDAAGLSQVAAARSAAATWYDVVDNAARQAAAGGDATALVSLVRHDGPADKAMGPAEDAVGSLVDAAVARRLATGESLAEDVQSATVALIIGIAATALLAALTGWLLSPEVAALSMSGSTLIVVANALLLRRVKMSESAAPAQGAAATPKPESNGDAVAAVPPTLVTK